MSLTEAVRKKFGGISAATLVAKKYVVFNNPRSSGEELAEEMVRMLVRVRRHMPIRLQRR